MKAVFYNKTGSIEGVHYREFDLKRAELKEGECRIALQAGSLNHLDLWVLKGLPHLKYQFPHIMGADICGEVIESRSKKFQKSDLVVLYPARFNDPSESYGLNETLDPSFAVRGENTPGAFVDELSVSESYLARKPEHLATEEAAAIPLAFLTAWQMIVEKAELLPGKIRHDSQSRILVHGAGSGVTHALLEILISFGLEENLVVTSRDPQKLSEWSDRGIKTLASGSEMENSLKELVWGRRFDIVFDHIGEAYFEMNIRLLKNGGRLVTCGATSGFSPQIDLRHIFFRQIRIEGSTMGTLRAFRQMMNWIGQNELRPKIASQFKFHEIQEALRLLDSGRQSGKIVCRA